MDKTTTNTATLTLKTVKYSGYYYLGGLTIKLKDKPSFIKRFCNKYFLGINWVDKESTF